MTTLTISTRQPMRPAGRARVECPPRVQVPRTRLTRRGRAVLAALVIVPLLVGGAVLTANVVAVAGATTSSSVHFEHVTVQPGDSLWSIAERVAPASDPRDVISAIASLNGLDSSAVQPGQSLAVPSQYASASR